MKALINDKAVFITELSIRSILKSDIIGVPSHHNFIQFVVYPDAQLADILDQVDEITFSLENGFIYDNCKISFMRYFRHNSELNIYIELQFLGRPRYSRFNDYSHYFSRKQLRPESIWSPQLNKYIADDISICTGRYLEYSVMGLQTISDFPIHGMIQMQSQHADSHISEIETSYGNEWSGEKIYLTINGVKIGNSTDNPLIFQYTAKSLSIKVNMPPVLDN